MLVKWWFLCLFSLVWSFPVEELSFKALVAKNEYDVAVQLLLSQQIEENDGSKGTVWFDTSSYELALYGFPLIGLYGINTETNFEYLESLSLLGEHAIDRGNHGDFVYILYKYLYSESLQGQSEQRSMLIKEMALGLNPAFNNREGSEQLIETLIESSSNVELKEIFREVGSSKSATMVGASLPLTAKKVYSYT